MNCLASMGNGNRLEIHELHTTSESSHLLKARTWKKNAGNLDVRLEERQKQVAGLQLQQGVGPFYQILA